MRIDVGDVEINVEQSGAGEPLVLIHGLGMSHALWVSQVEAFSDRYQTIAVDLRGFGASSKPKAPGSYAVEALAEDIAALPAKLGVPSAAEA